MMLIEIDVDSGEVPYTCSMKTALQFSTSVGFLSLGVAFVVPPTASCSS